MSDFWVFGYGSLMWRPGFAFEEAVEATLHGAHRALCVTSWIHRGTKERPGLVLGLDHGGSCRGMAFRIAQREREAVLAYLRERELVTNVYREVERTVRLGRSGTMVRATAYVVDRAHEQYAGNLDRERVLALVRGSAGISGPNRDYVIATAEHLAAAGAHDPLLEWLAEQLRADGETGTMLSSP